MDFIEYVKEERRKFVRIASIYSVEDHTLLRTKIDDLLIAYDQMVEKLENETKRTKEEISKG